MDYSDFFREWRDESLKAWTKAAAPTIQSDAFVEAMNIGSDYVLSQQKAAREAQVKALEAAGVPSRTDLARISNQIQLAEKRALQCEDRIEELAAAARTLAEKADAVTTALAASEATVAALEARVAAQAPQAAEVPPVPRRPRKRK